VKRPPINKLRDFAQLYFEEEDLPRIEWKKIAHMGYSNTRKNIIHLNPDTPLSKSSGNIVTGLSSYKPSVRLRLREGEQYFLILLHEIGHFEERSKFLPVPEEGISIIFKMQNETKNLVGYPTKDFNDKIWRLMRAKDLLEEKEKESCEDYESRLKSLQSWLCGDWDTAHQAVEEWAIKEFRKHRKRIKKILGYM
jgi:hypothetical protein